MLSGRSNSMRPRDLMRGLWLIPAPRQGANWSGLAPFAGRMERSETQLEPVFGGFPRVWRNGAKLRARFICAGAGVQVTVIYAPFLHFIHKKKVIVMQSIGIVWDFTVLGNGGKLHLRVRAEGVGL